MNATATAPKQHAVTAFRDAVRYHARYSLGQEWEALSRDDRYKAVSLAFREWVVDAMLKTEARYQRRNAKRLYYLSMEFLMGRSLSNNVHNLGVYEVCREALGELEIDIEEVIDSERDPALGNGGLGRLAACFLDSLASLGMPGYGYGINYEYGLFRQAIDKGQQRERPDHWQIEGNPWLIERPNEACLVPVYGRLEHGTDLDGHYNPMWLDWQVIIGVPHDLPVVGYGGETVNYLRLYSARSSDDFDMGIFNEGDYIKAVEQKIRSETISKVLYPSDSIAEGKELRLIQEYFLVACSVRDIMRRYLRTHDTFDHFPARVAIQLNDTHPALTVSELMRALVDEQGLSWDAAWNVTTQTLGYTNHTLLPEALEKWPVHLINRVLPRHMQIIHEINHRFLQQVAEAYPDDKGRLSRMSIIEEGHEKQVRMANLSIVGSHSVNGVAALHSELVKSTLVPEFHDLWPEKFNNKTNGVTQRRWLLHSNPELAALINDTLGDAWITDLDRLRGLEQHADDEVFRQRFMQIKRRNKKRMAEVIQRESRVHVDPSSLFDVQAKRIHEYKRQLLNVMNVIHTYLGIVEDGLELPVPKTHVFAGKAAPGYWAAKQIIKLINNVADVVNNDPRVRDQLKVAFVPDYRVTLAEALIPSADLSEQISTAGMEASGTGNMKFALNGALTIGTLDGANIEIAEEAGEENVFIFGLRAEQILEMRSRGVYEPWEYYHQSGKIRRVMDALRSDRFCEREPGLFGWIFNAVLEGGDTYFHLADLESYIDAQEEAVRQYRDRPLWARKAILNVARMGKFSSDRTIREYAREIWEIHGS